MHNISVNNSVVGAVNTGSTGTVDQSITALIQTGEPQLAEAVKGIPEAILQSGDLTRNQKNANLHSGPVERFITHRASRRTFSDQTGQNKIDFSCL